MVLLTNVLQVFSKVHEITLLSRGRIPFSGYGYYQPQFAIPQPEVANWDLGYNSITLPGILPGSGKVFSCRPSGLAMPGFSR
jgi:hypothetical protein